MLTYVVIYSCILYKALSLTRGLDFLCAGWTLSPDEKKILGNVDHVEGPKQENTGKNLKKIKIKFEI